MKQNTQNDNVSNKTGPTKELEGIKLQKEIQNCIYNSALHIQFSITSPDVKTFNSNTFLVNIIWKENLYLEQN